MSPILYLIIGVLSAIAYFVVNHSKNKTKYLQNIPGPPTTIFFGNALDFLFKGYEGLMQQIITYVDTYGKIVRVWTGPNKVAVVAADPKFMEYFLSSTKLIDKAQEYTYLENWLGTGLLTSTGAKWKKRRRMLTPAFHFSILEQYVKIFNDVGDILILKLKREVGKDKFNIYPIITLAALDIICEAAMGTSVNALNDTNSKYVKAVKKMCELVIARTFSPIHDDLYFLRPACYEEKAALKVVHNYSNAVIDRRIKELEKKNADLSVKDDNEFGIKKRLAFLDLLLQCKDEKGEPLSREDLREEVDTFMFEGHDTTASAITFTLYCIANHPEVQQKILEEQKLIFGSFDNVKTTQKELNEMKYLELVIKEALRLYPSVPYFARDLIEDLDYDGNIYPKGATIMFFIFHMQRNAEYFPDPEKFMPERFESTAGQNPFVYLPFSAGPRNCIGQKFAMMEMKNVISKIVRNFELLPAIPQQELILSAETILISKNGVWMALKNRIA